MNESGQQFQSVADSLPVLLWVVGPDRRCTFFNKRWLKFTGHTLEEDLALGWLGNIHPADAARCTTDYGMHFDRREEFHFEFRLRRADGDYRWMMANGAPEFSAHMIFAGYVNTCIDVSDLRLVRRQALIHKKLETLGYLAAGIAHDFNNLLASIVADAELVLAEPPRYQESVAVERIRSVAIRASEIVREVMIYAGRDEGEMAAVDLSLLVEEMVDLLKSSITKQAKLGLDLYGNPPPVWAEAAELRQLVMNLILNASEALRANEGEIHIATAPLVLTAPDAASGLPAGNYLRLEVSDTGKGMAPEVQARIFEPYFTTKRPGRGIGLSVAQRIVRRYGGAIRCQSAPGKGTQFVVLLPCAEAILSPRPTTETRASIAGVLTPGATVLVVEDEEGLRIAVSTLLRQEGLEVIEAADGKTALQLLRKHANSIDAVLLDLTLPGISSKDLIAAASRIRPDIKILLTSAYSSRDAAQALGMPQVKGFIRKPYLFRELSQALNELLEGSRTKSVFKAG